MAELEVLPVSLDTSTHEELKHVRGFLERDLRPQSLWTTSTSKSYNKPVPIYTTDRSSSSSTVPPPSTGPTSESWEFLRALDITNNAEFFLGPPRPLMDIVPAARQFSKARSLANSLDYMGPAMPKATPPGANTASSSSGLARQGAQHF